jgi:hypothetical protein
VRDASATFYPDWRDAVVFTPLCLTVSPRCMRKVAVRTCRPCKTVMRSRHTERVKLAWPRLRLLFTFFATDDLALLFIVDELPERHILDLEMQLKMSGLLDEPLEGFSPTTNAPYVTDSKRTLVSK